MKKKFLTFGTVIFLSMTAFTLFAQTTQSTTPLSTIEARLTANGKTWAWYKDSQMSADKSEVYAFTANHKVSITTAGKTTTSPWKVTLTDPTGAKSTILIGTKNYNLAFGSDTEHPEYMVLTGIKPTPAISSYYKSVIAR